MSWFSDFEFRKGGVYVKTTDQFVPVNKTILVEFFRWIVFYILIRILTVKNLFNKKNQKTIYFEPQTPRPWYIVWTAAQFANIKVATTNPNTADARFYFDDKTYGKPTIPQTNQVLFNYHCTDISKTHVADIFESVFGYPLRVDPEAHAGSMVVKSETNALHDGKIVQGPAKAELGLSYQRVVDTEKDGFTYDLRSPTIDGDVMVVFVKKRPVKTRFSNFNDSVELKNPTDIFSVDELQRIKTFCQKMSLDWGGLDVLRDKNDGRIYIVDVNKTDMSPIDPPIRQQIQAAKIMSGFLRDSLNK